MQNPIHLNNKLLPNRLGMKNEYISPSSMNVLRPSESEVMLKTPYPISRTQLVDQISELGIMEGDVVIVHSSLSRLGWVIGGAQDVVGALMESVGKSGTIVMPSHSTQLVDPVRWKNPAAPQEWQEIIRSGLPIYDPVLTPTRRMGVIAELFRTHPLAHRSSHPFYSFTAIGPHADMIITDHSLEDGLGEQSPLARLFDLNAYVLLLGLEHSINTSLHLAEHRCEFPGKADRVEGAPILLDGKRQWVRFRQLAYVSRDFHQLGVEFARETRLERIGLVGLGIGRLNRLRDLVEYATTWLPRRRPASLGL
jgi:aminoglycoside 3-N-acetyltransferase